MILQNGKRIDGCSDTVPVGTLQPYLGLVPPKGYLVCQGQLVSKITYSKLYEICGDTFGTSTETHFYLPDLRGKTLAGYDENDTTMNTIGKLLGQKTHTHTSAAHTHTTGNHTLTVAEMPSHRHSIDTYIGMVTSTDAFGLNDSSFDGLVGSDVMADGVNSTAAPSSKTSVIIGTTGGNGAHSHGNTGSTTPNDTGASTNYQPTITVNWIVKAVMLIPDYIIVEDTLASNSATDALSARQGKLLNEKFTDYATKSEIIQYLPLKGGTLTGMLTIGQGDAQCIHMGTNGRVNVTVGSDTNATVLGIIDGAILTGTTVAPLNLRGSGSSPNYNGIPLIETGSGTNGTYIKFFDGTMICTCSVTRTVTLNGAYGNLYGANFGSITFPATFVSQPYISWSSNNPDGNTRGHWVGTYNGITVSTTAVSGLHIYRHNSNEEASQIEVQVTAIGRWK